MIGRITVRCPYCGHKFRTEVNFPDWNKPFHDTYAKCTICEELFVVHDSHKYNEDGTIKEDESMNTYPEVHESEDNLSNLLRAIHDGDAFNYVSRGNLWNKCIGWDSMRDVFKELCYAVERHCDSETLDNIIEEFEDNLTDCGESYIAEMPWYDNRWREDNE